MRPAADEAQSDPRVSMPADLSITKDVFEAALGFIRDGRVADGCGVLLEQVVDADLEGDVGLTQIAKFLWDNDYRDEATQVFRFAYEEDADNVDRLGNLVNALHHPVAGKANNAHVAALWRELLPLAETARQRQPDVSQWYHILAWGYFTIGAYDKCREVVTAGVEKGDKGVDFQAGLPLPLEGPQRALIAMARNTAAAGWLDAHRGLYEGPAAVTWGAVTIGAETARLGGATVGVTAAQFEVTPAAEPDSAPRPVDAEADGVDGPRTLWRASVDGLEPGTDYRVRLTADGAKGDPVRFTTAKETPPEVDGLGAVWCGDQGAVVAGTVGGTTLPTRYHFAYGEEPERLENRTPEKFVPPGRRLRVHQEAVDAMEDWKLCAVERDVVGESADPESADAFALRLGGPFCKDRNHTNGIGVTDLFLGWFARWFTPSDSETTGWGHAEDLRDAEVELVLRPRGLDAGDFVLAANVQSATGERTTESMKDTAPFALTAEAVDTATLDDAGWNRLRFTFSSGPRAWTFAGNNPTDQPDAARYAYMPIGDVLARHRGNLFFWFALGDWRRPPVGDMDLRAMALRWRDWSVLTPETGTRLTEFPEDSLSDPLNLTCGHLDDPDAMWFSAPDPTGPQTFTWSFGREVSPTLVKLHQNPLKPARAVEVLTSVDGETFESAGLGDLPPARPVIDPPKPVVVALAGRPVGHLRLVIHSGHQADFWGLDGVQAFAEDEAPVPEVAPASLSEELSGLAPGQTLHYRLVAENAAGRAEGPVQEVAIPETRAPVIVSGRLLAQTEKRIRLFLDVRPGGLETTLSGTVTGPDGGAWTAPEQNIGDNTAVRHAVFALECPKKDGPYRAEITASNEAGDSAPFVFEWKHPLPPAD